MKYLRFFPLGFVIICVSCKKEAMTPSCNLEVAKPYAGTYEMRAYWPVYDTVTKKYYSEYDTVLVDFTLDYQTCNQLFIREKGLSFPFNSAMQESVLSFSTDPQWTSLKRLSVVSLDSINYVEERGHLGRVFNRYGGRRKK